MLLLIKKLLSKGAEVLAAKLIDVVRNLLDCCVKGVKEVEG